MNFMASVKKRKNIHTPVKQYIGIIITEFNFAS